MMVKEEKRIYVIIPATVETAGGTYEHNLRHFVDFSKPVRVVVQPPGRQIAQACHVVSKLRFEIDKQYFGSTGPCPGAFDPITTIILQARDSKEMIHNFVSLNKKKLCPVLFTDENEAAYGQFKPITALAVLATPSQVKGILDYLPLWGS